MHDLRVGGEPRDTKFLYGARLPIYKKDGITMSLNLKLRVDLQI